MRKTIDYYQFLGIGPFIVGESGAVTDLKVYGKPADIYVKGAVGKIGEMCLELMQPVKGESLQMEFLRKRGEGVIQVCCYTDDIDGEIAKLAEKGFQAISTGTKTDGSAFAMVDTRKVGDVLLVVERFGPKK